MRLLEVGFQLNRLRSSSDGFAAVEMGLSEGWDVGAGRRLVEDAVRLLCAKLEDARLFSAPPCSRDSCSVEAASRSRLALVTAR